MNSRLMLYSKEKMNKDGENSFLNKKGREKLRHAEDP
jgi:hypothetical protein